MEQQKEVSCNGEGDPSFHRTPGKERTNKAIHGNSYPVVKGVFSKLRKDLSALVLMEIYINRQFLF